MRHALGLAAAAILAGFAGAAGAAERWVSPAGDDGGPGTRARPWRTLAKAAAEAGPGTTVWLASGIWRERLLITRSGTAAAPVLFAAAPGATPVLDGGGTGLDHDMAGVVHLENVAWVEVRGLTVRGAGPGETAAGILARRCEHLAIRGCSTSGTVSSGIGAWWCRDVTVADNDVQDACHGGSQECLSVAGCDGFLVEGNTVHDCGKSDHGGEGIDAKHGANGIVRHNRVFRIARVGIYVDAWDSAMHDVEVCGNLVHDTEANGYALAAEDGGTLSRVRFHDNVAYRNRHAGLTLADWGEPVPHHGLEDLLIEHNTFVENGTSGWGGGVRLDNAEAAGIVVRDNLIADNGGGQLIVDKRPRSAVLEHNFLTGDGSGEGETAGVGAVRGIPRLRPEPAGGVVLAPGSPGAGFGARPDGCP